MYAVIKTGGKQFRVSEGQMLRVEKLPGVIGDDVVFDQVLLLGGDATCQIGKPFVQGASVTAKIMTQGRAKKIRIMKLKRRKHHLKRQGHRQYYTAVQISGIQIAE